MSNKLIFILALILFFKSTSATQFNHLSSVNGLPHPAVRAMVQGSDGLVWVGTVKGLSQYNGYDLRSFNSDQFEKIKKVNSIVADKNSNSVWVGTDENGVFLTNGYEFSELLWPDLKPEKKLDQILMVGDVLWLFFAGEIHLAKNKRVLQQFKNPIKNKTYSVVFDSKSDQVIIAGTDHVFKINNTTHVSTEITVDSIIKNRRVSSLTLDSNDRLWLGRSDGLYRFDEICNCFVQAFDVFSEGEIYSLASDHERLWIGTPLNGLYAFNFKSGVLSHFQHSKQGSGQINDNSILTVMNADHDMLWVGTFNDGVNFIDTKTLNFEQLSNKHSLLNCSISNVIHDLYEADTGDVWLATDLGLVVFNAKSNLCQNFLFDTNDQEMFENELIYSISKDQDQLIWLTTSKGFYYIDLATKNINKGIELNNHFSAYFVSKFNDNEYFIGSNQGLFKYDLKNDSLHGVVVEGGTGSDLLFDKHVMLRGTHWFGARNGLYQLTNNKLIKKDLKTDQGELIMNITGMTADGEGGLLLASEESVLVRLNGDGSIDDLSFLFDGFSNKPFLYEILLDAEKMFWLSSDVGLFKLDLKTSKLNYFGANDGVDVGGFIKNSSYLSGNGKLYFGGKQGFVAFYPENIKTNINPPIVMLNGLSQLNNDLAIGSKTLGGYLIEQPINQLHEIQLGYQDIVIGFEFSGIDYSDANGVQYAFRLKGFNDQWSNTGSDNRRATYTNLNPGEYQFQVKAANKNGIWSKQPKTLNITVKPAPWLSPWAYALYALTFMVVVFSFIRHRTASARRRASELEVVVNERTQELKTQKQMVESLLDHKNELFANVTHEFKTPLALIKGPAEQLLATGELYPYKSKLNMITRNANRLLVMVGQILKLSEVEQQKTVVRENQAVQPILNMLYESFKPLAEDKNIEITSSNDSNGQVYATPECIEMVVGNLLSNAIKYTAEGGQVVLSSFDQGAFTMISVKDNGSGIAEKDQALIFDRFTRLDSHRNIQGTGIGLAVVKEITQANGGSIELISGLGSGCEFIIKMPLTQWENMAPSESAGVTELVDNTANELRADVLPTTAINKNAAVKILIIEDNLDMRTHVGEILQTKYQCLFADRGRKGIAAALREMPDIVICDVMMPEMDGYQVTRILRHDAKTSHIPIVLLTALNTKESRIKGWRENIDVYLTKPFDAKELHATLAAILNVRKILQQKTQASLTITGTTEALDLPKQDLKFVNQLKKVIAENYHDSLFMRPQLADLLAVSERQLQRKVKALIDDTPMNLLRNFRLEMAAKTLKDGYQVSLVGDACGFSSVSYFAACFKKKYGMTPKKYQMLEN